MNDLVYVLAARGTDLYAGGPFTIVDGVATAHVAKWNGAAWSGLGGGTSKDVASLGFAGDGLYVGGDFQAADGKASSFVGLYYVGACGDGRVGAECARVMSV